MVRRRFPCFCERRSVALRLLVPDPTEEDEEEALPDEDEDAGSWVEEEDPEEAEDVGEAVAEVEEDAFGPA